jgi:formylglycine-generating enzyme required for sulfatase activity
MIRSATALLLVLALAGCGIGVGGDGGQAPVVPAVGSGIAGAAAGTRATWQVLDLGSGSVLSAESMPGLAGDPAYRDRLMAFRLVDLQVASLGQQPGSFGRQDDELAQTVAAPGFYLGAFEVTRGQWRRLAGSSPWDGLPGPSAADAGRDDLPATGLSAELVRAALGRWSARLALPQPWQWEAGARAGSAAAFPWGDDVRASVAGRYAATADTGGTLLPVGSLAANPLGLHDLCGNAWELVADGSVRGGSWADALVLARPANRALPDPALAHPAFGVRLVLRP